MLGCYERRIIELMHCSEAEAQVVEDLMRGVIFHSTLDWLTPEEFEAGAREALQALREMRANGTLPDEYIQMLLRRSRQEARRKKRRRQAD
jgi:hypothetical protein